MPFIRSADFPQAVPGDIRAHCCGIVYLQILKGKSLKYCRNSFRLRFFQPLHRDFVQYLPILSNLIATK